MKKRVVVNDKMQKNYSYILSEPIGKNFDPEFQPELTPNEMLKLGVFGGVYMRDCQKEFPASWFKKAKFAPHSTGEHLPEINFFEVNASQPLKIWKSNGWINQEHDPRGWFQWYCRYYMGRRLPEEDLRQIKRWKAFKRHLGALKKGCTKKDLACRRKTRQALLHWAYDSRKI